jgi:hypothetical protein
MAGRNERQKDLGQKNDGRAIPSQKIIRRTSLSVSGGSSGFFNHLIRPRRD